MDIVRTHPITQDLPLPGHYPCLTAQLNVTRYTAGGTLRVVLSIREPNEHLEVWRQSIGTTEASTEVVARVGEMLMQAMAQMHWLQTGEVLGI